MSLALVLLLGACAETQLAAYTAKRVVAGPPASPQGAYKIGEPYRVDGVWYRPAEDPHYDRVGVASWYGSDFHGRRTANGAVYDMNGLSAAHKTLPMPSLVRVTNLENGRSLVLTVNDRGPFVRGRIIDVSRRAAQLLGFYHKGTARVRVQAVGEWPKATLIAATAPGPAPALVAAPSPSPETAAMPAAAAPSPAIIAREPLLPPVVVAAVEPPATAPAVVSAGRAMYVQAAAFSDPDNARRASNRLGRLGPGRTVRATVGGRDVYRVQLGPLATRAAANALLDRVIAAGHRDAYVIVD
ncbi:MAG: septal ring lytic transglycosylase RlpA family protein [Alphaproteobacteria bacterium]